MQSKNPAVIEIYQKMARKYKEKFYFFAMKEVEDEFRSFVYTVGKDFTRKIEIAYTRNNPKLTEL